MDVILAFAKKIKQKGVTETAVLGEVFVRFLK